jgi:hypothetical protein
MGHIAGRALETGRLGRNINLRGFMKVMSKEQGALELSLMNAEQDAKPFESLLLEGLNAGIPAEIMTRLENVWKVTQRIAGEVIALGKIIVTCIFEFLRAHPGITVGIALGAAVGALSTGIPLLGPLLAPLVSKISIFYGAGLGAAYSDGVLTSDPIVAAISLANKFFELLREIFLAVSEYLQIV